MADINDVFLNSIGRWAEAELDDRIETAIDKFDSWIQNFDEEERIILSNLISNFDYYSRKNIISIIEQLNKDAVVSFKISNKDSVISVITKSDGRLNSSYEYWMIHRFVSRMSKEIYCDSLDKIADIYWKNIKNIVFVDDCSGTGEQFIKFLKRQKKELIGKRIILLVVEIMKTAKENIEQYAQNNGLDIRIKYYTLKDKALKNATDEDGKKFIKMSVDHEICGRYVCGFENTEALMAFYNNTPNDTLGLFWFSSSKNDPIFLREIEEKPGWKDMSKEHRERRHQQYGSKSQK